MKGSIGQLWKMTKPRWIYRDAHYLVSEIEIDPEAASLWVPRPLRLAEPKAFFFTAWFPETSFGSVYCEAGLFLPVRHRCKQAVHCPWMLVDDDVALIVGRELLGYPKKLGTVEWNHSGEQIRTTASRRGKTVLTMEGTLGDVIARPPPILGVPHRNVRSSLGLSIPWIVAFTPKEDIIEVRRAHLDVRIGESDRDPLAKLGAGRVLESRLHRVNLGRGSLPRPVAFASPSTYLRMLPTRIH